MENTRERDVSLIKRQYIDWEKTGNKLQHLRADNVSLRRYVCYKLRYDMGECSGECSDCEFEIDLNISRAELGKVFNVSDSVVFNWEKGKTPVALEDLLFYCNIAGVELSDIIVFKD